MRFERFSFLIFVHTLTVLEFEGKYNVCSQQHILILEDYHLITTARIHETLSFVLDHQPATLRLVISARCEPALPLPRLRARNELSEIRAADLRFSLQETQEFLHQAHAPHLSSEYLFSLDTRLQGWAAGLRLAALTLQKHTSVKR